MKYLLSAVLLVGTLNNAMGFNSDINFRLLDQHGAVHSLRGYNDLDYIIAISQSDKCSPVLNLQQRLTVSADVKLKALFINAEFDALRSAPRDDLSSPTILFDRSEQISRVFKFVNIGDFVIVNPKTLQIAAAGNLFNGFQFNFVSKKFKFRTNTRKEAFCKIKFDDSSSLDFSRDVFPALTRSCLGCHTSKDSIELFKSQESIYSWKTMMLRSIREGRMPGGAYNELYPLYDQATPKDMKTVVLWLEGGADLGKDGLKLINNFKNDQEELIKQQLAELGVPDIVLTPNPLERVKANGSGYVKIYQFQNKTNEDLALKATFLETNLNIVHHVLLHSTSTLSSNDTLRKVQTGTMLGRQALEDSINSKAKTLIDGTVVEGNVYHDKVLATYSRRKGLQNPGLENKYFFVPKNSYFSIEIHYNPSGKDEVDTTKLSLYAFKTKNLKSLNYIERFTMIPLRKYFKIPPKTKRYTVRMEYPLKKSIELTAYSLHTHYRGISGKLSIMLPGSKTEDTVFSVPFYQFKNQTPLILKTPLLAPKGALLISEIIYDNSSGNEANPDPDQTLTFGLSPVYHENHAPRIYFTTTPHAPF